ncbi:hypothetical protein PYW08_000620 [Mythimna loreyi]|uniref:Uncharacterized protein n=1 Tax=Mythimna loreyi TaxID=667449 RepID=A0ACC2RD18_9NEOP|nr:hypothetical protein PYW08_000620 [Mythimna loreyi]
MDEAIAALNNLPELEKVSENRSNDESAAKTTDPIEEVNFAPPSWLDCLWKVFKEARESCEPTMFSMEHLLYNIGCDKEPVLDIVKRALPLYDQMVREEVFNRQMLHERGLPIVQELLSAREQEPSSSYKVRPQEECDYCRASLFLSKNLDQVVCNSKKAIQILFQTVMTALIVVAAKHLLSTLEKSQIK